VKAIGAMLDRNIMYFRSLQIAAANDRIARSDEIRSASERDESCLIIEECELDRASPSHLHRARRHGLSDVEELAG